MSRPRGHVYTARSGDEVYRIPTPGAFGWMFACSGDPGGAQLPTAVLLRDGRVFPLRPDLLRGSGYVTDTKPSDDATRPTGITEEQFLVAANIKWRAWAVANGIDPADGGPASGPAWAAAGGSLDSLAIAAEAWGWVAA